MINNTDGLYGFYHMPPILCYDVFIWTVIHALPKRERTKEIYFITQRDLLLFMNTLIINLGRWI